MTERSVGGLGQPGPKHVHIGAGSFGLGMVVELCHRAGLEMAVLNRQSTKDHHQLLRELGNYHVTFDDDPNCRITLSPKFHYCVGEHDQAAIDLLAGRSVELITTSVKKDNLVDIAPLLARALQKRRDDGINGQLCILACENFQRNSEMLQTQIALHTPKESRKGLFSGVFFCNSLVDRVCASISCRTGEVEVPVESFHGWVVEDPGVNLPILDLLSVKKLLRIAGKLEFNGHEIQKYWCMNGIHLAAAAYAYNYDPNLTHFHNALAIREIRRKIEVLQQEIALAFILYVSRNGLQDWFSVGMVDRYNKAVYRRLRANQTDTIARVLKQQGSRAVGIAEVLDRIERLLAPQCEIVAYKKGLVKPKYEGIALHPAPRPMERLELDDAITQVVLAMRRFASEYGSE